MRDIILAMICAISLVLLVTLTSCAVLEDGRIVWCYHSQPFGECAK